MTRALCLSLMLAALSAGSVLAQPRQNDRDEPFRQFFTIRGIDFSEEQQAQADKLLEQYAPQLAELQRKRNDVFTREQRQAQREATRAARDAGKQGQELRDAVDKALQLTDEQQKQLADLRKQQVDLAQKIQAEVRALLTPQQRRQAQGGQRNNAGGQPMPPTHRNVKYGPHERNVMDVWLAESDQPSPVLMSIHGGGFRGGNKSVDRRLLQMCLDAGISVVAITYRLSDTAIAPAQHHDSARAVQFVRHNAKEWNLDAKRIASTGGSAGAGLSLWLGFHDDLADPDNADPVLRESTRLTCMSVYNGQSSYDPRFIRKMFPESDTYKHTALAQLYDVDLGQLDNLPEEKYKLFEEVSAINHLSKDDAPSQMIYGTRMDTPVTNQGIGIHHPKFGKLLKEQMDQLGIECQVHEGVNRNSDEWTQLTFEFVMKHFDRD